MFSKSKINDPAPQDADVSKPAPSSASASPAPAKQSEFKASAPKAKPPASVLSSDLHVTGNMKTTGDVQVEGTVVADDVVINGRIVGRVRGLKVRLTSTARVEGDIIHKTIAIESSTRPSRSNLVRISKVPCSVRMTR